MLYEWGQSNKPTGEELLSMENKVALNCQWQKISKSKNSVFELISDTAWNRSSATF
jgi:hypothetical protein